MDQTYVSLDLETTGLSPESDAIIEVGAIKFRGHELLETFCSLVNPNRPLPPRIRVLTGITDSEVRGAPPFSALSGKLAAFIGNHPLVGHNLPFDLAFLAHNSLPVLNPFCDTRDLAAILLPNLPDRSLASVAAALGVPRPVQHRALPDAAAARDVFLKLLELALQLDPLTISQIVQLTAQPSAEGWPLRHLFRDLERAKARVALSEGKRARSKVGLVEGDGLGLLAPPTLSPSKGLTPRQKVRPLDMDALSAILGEGGPLAGAFPGYEFRPEQLRMTQAVARAFNEGHHLKIGRAHV